MPELTPSDGGAPIKQLTDEDKAQVEKLASVLTKAQLADYFGMCENTYRRIEQENPELIEAYKKGRSKAIASVAANLVNQARDGNTSAAIFYLKTQAGWKETIDISGGMNNTTTPIDIDQYKKLRKDMLNEDDC